MPEEYRFTSDRMFWIKIEKDNNVRIGITDTGQKKIGVLDRIRLRYIGKKLQKGDEFGTFHGSKKWFGALPSPITGEIVEVNRSVIDTPRLVNEDFYRRGWLICIKASNLEEDLKQLEV